MSCEDVSAEYKGLVSEASRLKAGVGDFGQFQVGELSLENYLECLLDY